MIETLNHFANLIKPRAKDNYGMYYMSPERINTLNELTRLRKEALAMQANDAENIAKYKEIENQKQAPLIDFIKNEFSTQAPDLTPEELAIYNNLSPQDKKLFYPSVKNKQVKLIDTIINGNTSINDKLTSSTRIIQGQLKNMKDELNIHTDQFDMIVYNLDKQINSLDKITESISDPNIQNGVLNVLLQISKGIEEQKRIMETEKIVKQEEPTSLFNIEKLTSPSQEEEEPTSLFNIGGFATPRATQEQLKPKPEEPRATASSMAINPRHRDTEREIEPRPPREQSRLLPNPRRNLEENLIKLTDKLDELTTILKERELSEKEAKKKT